MRRVDPMKGNIRIFDRIFGSGKEKPTNPQPERIESVTSREPEPPKAILIKGVVRDMPPLEIRYRLDVKTFLSQTPLPYLWPGNEDHRKSVDNYKSPQDLLRYY